MNKLKQLTYIFSFFIILSMGYGIQTRQNYTETFTDLGITAFDYAVLPNFHYGFQTADLGNTDLGSWSAWMNNCTWAGADSAIRVEVDNDNVVRGTNATSGNFINIATRCQSSFSLGVTVELNDPFMITNDTYLKHNVSTSGADGTENNRVDIIYSDENNNCVYYAGNQAVKQTYQNNFCTNVNGLADYQYCQATTEFVSDGDNITEQYFRVNVSVCPLNNLDFISYIHFMVHPSSAHSVNISLDNIEFGELLVGNNEIPVCNLYYYNTSIYYLNDSFASETHYYEIEVNDPDNDTLYYAETIDFNQYDFVFYDFTTNYINWAGINVYNGDRTFINQLVDEEIGYCVNEDNRYLHLIKLRNLDSKDKYGIYYHENCNALFPKQSSAIRHPFSYGLKYPIVEFTFYDYEVGEEFNITLLNGQDEYYFGLYFNVTALNNVMVYTDERGNTTLLGHYNITNGDKLRISSNSTNANIFTFTVYDNDLNTKNVTTEIPYNSNVYYDVAEKMQLALNDDTDLIIDRYYYEGGDDILSFSDTFAGNIQFNEEGDYKVKVFVTDEYHLERGEYTVCGENIVYIREESERFDNVPSDETNMFIRIFRGIFGGLVRELGLTQTVRDVFYITFVIVLGMGFLLTRSLNFSLIVTSAFFLIISLSLTLGVLYTASMAVLFALGMMPHLRGLAI